MDPTFEGLEKAVSRGRWLVLGGAGLSTESGIPDYRGDNSKPRASIQYQPFVTEPWVRRRYWARSFVGWPWFSRREPNPGHLALAQMQDRWTGLVTQNVDRLHHKAGSEPVIELHGALAEVRCLHCGAVERRDGLQERLHQLNPQFLERARGDMAPDGDVDLEEQMIQEFQVADCLACGGPLKPDVVFFGEAVPKTRVEAALRWLEQSEGLLVLGSSLTVFSGFRFARKARELGLTIAIVNKGPTRADEFADYKLEAGLGEVLPALARSKR